MATIKTLFSKIKNLLKIELSYQIILANTKKQKSVTKKLVFENIIYSNKNKWYLPYSYKSAKIIVNLALYNADILELVRCQYFEDECKFTFFYLNI